MSNPMIETKICAKCFKEKYAEEFHRNRARADVIETYCIDCMSERKREQYAHAKRKASSSKSYQK